MLQDIKNTIKHTAIYGLSRVFTRAVSLILIPIYTSYFTSETIANINMLESFWQYIFTICMFAVETAIINFCASTKDESIRKKLIFSFFLILISNSLILLLLSYFLSGQISFYIFKDIGLYKVIIYCFLISVFESILIIPLTIARLNNKPGIYSIIAISNLAVNLILQLIFILILHFNFEYIFIAKFISPALIFLFTLPYIIKNTKFNFDRKAIKQILIFCSPLMIAMLFSLLLNSVDRFILTNYVSKEQIAIYTIGYSMGSVTNAFILAPFNLAINVIFWKKIEDANFLRFMTKSSTYLYFAMITSALFITFFIPYLIKIFVRNDQLWPATNIIPIILFANCFVALFTFPSLDLYYKRKTNIILLLIIMCLIFSIVMNIILIPYIGIYGSAFTALASYILLITLGFQFTRKFSFTKLELYKIFLLSVLYVLFALVSIFVTINNIFLDIFIKLIYLILNLYFLYILKFFEEIELIKIKEFTYKIFRK